MESREAIFAGGCFWCMQKPFDSLDGVLSTTVGYTGGQSAAPSYEEVCTGRTGHAEAVRVTYDPARIGYADLLRVFWRNIDPTARNRQFADVGSQYRTAIFYLDDEQRRLAEASKRELQASGRFQGAVVTEVVPAGPFYPAEEYHQGYYRKQPVPYRRYRVGSGREAFLSQAWSDAADDGAE